MKFHDAANMFPMMNEGEFTALVDDIRVNGLIEPIWTFNDEIIDGRNRFKGCGEAGVDPVFREWKGTDPLAFVVSENLRRRHLDAGRRAAIAVRRRNGEDSALDRFLAKGKELQRQSLGRGKKGSQKTENLFDAYEATATMFQTNRQYVADSVRVRKADPALLEQVIEGELSLQEALDELAERRREHKRKEIADSVEEQPMPERQYPVLLCDPPWRYEFTRSENRAIENQYPTMDADELAAKAKELPALDDAVLFMWATSPKLVEALDLIAVWNFTYRTSMVWVKDKIGMGYYARQQHELLLIAARGELPVPDPKARPSSVIEAPRGKHSAKPDVFYEVIERMYPELPKVELFARQEREGWASWGNQQ